VPSAIEGWRKDQEATCRLDRSFTRVWREGGNQQFPKQRELWQPPPSTEKEPPFRSENVCPCRQSAECRVPSAQ
jgi:hypothetical protein